MRIVENRTAPWNGRHHINAARIRTSAARLDKGGTPPGDDKARAAVWIANLIQYKKEGFKPDRDIIVVLTADEEGGGPFNGVDWLPRPQ